MRAVVLRRCGGLDALEQLDWPRPEIAPGEVLVAVHAVTAAALDVDLRKHATERHIQLPRVLGLDPAGVVEQVGAGVTRFRPGDRVAIGGVVHCGECERCRRGDDECARQQVIGLHRDGGQADYVAIPEGNLVPVPDGIALPEAACMALTYPVAWNLLVNGGRLHAGRRVLVMAAGGGVGVAAIAIAKALGAQVIAAAGSAWKLDLCRELLGADAVVDYTQPGWSEQVRAWSDGLGVDLVVENIASEALFGEAMESLAHGGRLVTCGAHGGGVVSLDVRKLYLRRQAIVGCNAAPQSAVEAVWEAVADGRVPPPPIHDRFPLERIAEAHELIEARRNFGRVALIVRTEQGDPA
jgi:NADPH:quinone reductase-like Zn-dependent oxidoreductase